MKRSHRISLLGLLLAIGMMAGIVQLFSQTPASRPRRIAVFGSSVAFGTGDEFAKEGYTGLLREMLMPRGWEVFNQSRGGDTTKTAASRFAPEGAPAPNVRYLMTVNPGYVVIGLSLTNEGILEAKTPEEKEAVLKQFTDGMKGFIDRARQNKVTPVITTVYPRMSYTPVEYEYVRRMNLIENTWDVPSINLLGALDDGTGRYTIGFDSDDRHPNAAGHHELFSTIVPTLFEALEKGKPIPTRPAGVAGYARVIRSAGALPPFAFASVQTMHPFAMSFRVRAERDGTVAAISGSTLSATTETKRAGQREYQSMTLKPDRPFMAFISAQNGKWTYQPGNGAAIRSEVSADSQWHDIVLSHYTARGETLLFVDGKLAGRVAERLQSDFFLFGGAGAVQNHEAPPLADYKDLFIFRSALNADEAAALHEGKILQASLEVYAPLNDAQFRQGEDVENRAQSLAILKVGTGRIAHVAGN